MPLPVGRGYGLGDASADSLVSRLAVQIPESVNVIQNPIN
jgi:hypothetical protein